MLCQRHGPIFSKTCHDDSAMSCDVLPHPPFACFLAVLSISPVMVSEMPGPFVAIFRANSKQRNLLRLSQSAGTGYPFWTSGKHACACAYAILPVRIRRPRRRQGGERQRRHYNQPGARKEQTARAREREADKRRTQGARATEQGGTKELRKTKASRRTASQQVSRAREKEENTRHHQVQERGGKRAARRKYASLRVAREPFWRPQHESLQLKF